MPRLYLFNADSDYALASDREYYTCSAHVVQIRKALALLPAVYADPGDAILCLDSPEDVSDSFDGVNLKELADAKGVRIIFPAELARMNESQRSVLLGFSPEPWGWNRSVRRLLLDRIGPMAGLPEEKEIERIRELSHRRTTIAMLTEMKPLLNPEIELPQEISDPQVAVDAFRQDPERYFKAPWSSSGRGIMLTDDLEERHVRPWVGGIINRQGSVMMEKAYRRRLDFATEWRIKGGKATFLGYSVFNVSRRGKYHGNHKGGQTELLGLIRGCTGEWSDSYLDMQGRALEKVLSGYEGPVGVDMLVTDSGALNPCVELNLRHTMGMVALENV